MSDGHECFIFTMKNTFRLKQNLKDILWNYERVFFIMRLNRITNIGYILL